MITTTIALAVIAVSHAAVAERVRFSAEAICAQAGLQAACAAGAESLQEAPLARALELDDEEGGGRRKALPVPLEIAARYAKAPMPETIELKTVGERGGYVKSEGVLSTVQPPLPFEFYKPKKAGPHSVIMVFPILGGGGSLERRVSVMLAERGHSVVNVLRPQKPFHRAHDAAYMEKLFRSMISGARTLLDWGLAQGGDPQRIGFVGFSMGGIVGTTFLAAEQARVRRSFVALAGADVPYIIENTMEAGILSWLKKMAKDGYSKEFLIGEIRKHLISDPLYTAQYVSPHGMLFLRGHFDQVIPHKSSEKLWELLGRPRLFEIPVGHYSSAAFYAYIKARIVGHFGRFEKPRK